MVTQDIYVPVYIHVGGFGVQPRAGKVRPSTVLEVYMLHIIERVS